MNKDAFGRQLRAARKDRHLTTNAVGNICSLDPMYIRQLECGNKSPSFKTFIDFCNLLHVSPQFLLRGNVDTETSDTMESIMRYIETLTPKQMDRAYALLKLAFDNEEE